MATTHDHLVTGDLGPTSDDDSILDLSQRTPRVVVIDDWTHQSSVPVDSIAEDEWKRRSPTVNDTVQPSTHQDLSMSDNATMHRSTIDAYCAARNKPTRSRSSGVIQQLQPCLHPSPSDASTFLWSKYLAVIGERAVSDEFFDHYLASIESSLEIDMKLEYCYDVQGDLYWLTQIQLVSHSLILLHYVGLPDDDTSHDFWASLYGQRCHPIGWCKEHRKLMLPPPIVRQQENVQVELSSQTTPPICLFDQNIGLTPAEQFQVGMIFELQDLRRPWTLWFVRIVSNHGGRLHLRYVTSLTARPSSSDIHLFYLDYRLHPIGWISSIYSYDPPVDLPLFDEKQTLIDHCLSQSKAQFLPANLFKEQEEIGVHRFAEGMKLEVFEANSQQIYVGRIGRIHNEFYFDVHLEGRTSEVSFVGHSTHPYLLPPHWAAEHRLALMKSQGLRQPEDYWAKQGIGDLASERCFNLITLNAAGSDRAEPGMKMELICLVAGEDRVFSVTLIHVVDHLMWLRIDNPTSLTDDRDFFHVLPINSLDVFPVGWARHHGFQLVPPMDYPVEVTTQRINREELFSSVTHFPRIPRIYLSDVDLLTLYVNIRCFSGPHFCSSRLARLPSKFGPGPCRSVLVEMFHHLLSASWSTAHRALRRLAHRSRLSTEFVKVAKKSPPVFRPISIPTDSRLVHRYLRHVCSQLEACANLISLREHLAGQRCPDRCHRLTQTFTFGSEKKPKRVAVGQPRQRKGKRSRPALESRNPVSWNVDEVCWYLSESGCSFALKTIAEQEIDGAALLLLDDLNTVQDLLEFKLGPAVKFFHVVEELRRQVIETFHSSSS